MSVLDVTEQLETVKANNAMKAKINFFIFISNFL